MPHVVVPQHMPPAVRQFITGRSALVRVWNRLHSDLGERYELFRGRRNPDDDRLFDYVIDFRDNGRRIRLRFSVDDSTAQGTLFVVSVTGGPA